MGDGAGQGGIAPHHLAVLRRAVVGVLELTVGLLQEQMQLLVVLEGSLANEPAAQTIFLGHDKTGGRPPWAAGRPARTLTQAIRANQPCQRERTACRELFTKPSAPIHPPGPHTDVTAEPAVSDPSRSGRTIPALSAEQRCPRCGGSGQLRTGHGAYRSCLHCAGRGILDQGAILQGTPAARAAARA
jgi:hypothetical protein